MNRYMNELAQMIPSCAAVPRRLDKLSILKMAVDHMKTLRGLENTHTTHVPPLRGLNISSLTLPTSPLSGVPILVPSHYPHPPSQGTQY